MLVLTGKSYRARTIFCEECFSHFRTENAFQTHSKVCKSRENQIKIFSEKGQTLKYTDNCNNFKRIFIGYCDFESVLEKTNSTFKCKTCLNSRNLVSEKSCPHSYTQELSKHIPISVSLIIVDKFGKLVHEFTYTGYDCVIKLIKEVLACEEKLVQTIKFKRYMVFGEKERTYHEATNICHICKNMPDSKGVFQKPFTTKDIKVSVSRFE